MMRLCLLQGLESGAGNYYLIATRLHPLSHSVPFRFLYPMATVRIDPFQKNEDLIKTDLSGCA